MAYTFIGKPYNLLTYTGASAKFTRGPAGLGRFGAHNLYLNSAIPDNQSITVVNGATYSVVITGSVSITASGAATGTWTAGTQNFTAATGTLTFASTSGTGTVHVRRTPSESTYFETAGVARFALPFEWDAAGAMEGVLSEPASTNLLVRSEALDSASWTKTAATTTADSTASPDGLTTADTFTNNNGGVGDAIIVQSVAAAASTTYTYSRFVKANISPVVRMDMFFTGGVSTDYGISINLSTLIITTPGGANAPLSSGYEAWGNGWYRVWLTATSPAATTTCRCDLRTDTTNGANSIYVGGAQLEALPFASSYIPTYASAVVRSDSVSALAGASFPLVQGTGTLYLEAKRKVGTSANTAGFGGVTLFTDANNRLAVRHVTGAAASYVDATAASGGVTQADTSNVAATANVTTKQAVAFATNDIVVALNGTITDTDTSATIPDFTTLNIGTDGGLGVGGAPAYIRKVAYFPRKMSNAELQARTA